MNFLDNCDTAVNFKLYNLFHCVCQEMPGSKSPKDLSPRAAKSTEESVSGPGHMKNECLQL